jgi:hypothetical protein
VWYIDQDGRVGGALVYRTSAPRGAPPIRLQLPGLRNGRYAVHYPDGMTQTHSAAGLAALGVVVPLDGDFVSAMVRIRPSP